LLGGPSIVRTPWWVWLILFAPVRFGVWSLATALNLPEALGNPFPDRAGAVVVERRTRFDPTYSNDCRLGHWYGTVLNQPPSE
jgi:hypothetical protein